MTTNGELSNGDFFVPLAKWAHQILGAPTPVRKFSHIDFYLLPLPTRELFPILKHISHRGDKIGYKTCS